MVVVSLALGVAVAVGVLIVVVVVGVGVDDVNAGVGVSVGVVVAVVVMVGVVPTVTDAVAVAGAEIGIAVVRAVAGGKEAAPGIIAITLSSFLMWRTMTAPCAKTTCTTHPSGVRISFMSCPVASNTFTFIVYAEAKMICWWMALNTRAVMLSLPMPCYIKG